MKIKEINGFKGMYAETSHQVGEIVCVVEGEVISSPNRYSVQLENGSHINVKAPIMYINHNCDANIELRGREFVAIKNIQPEEEIVFDYTETEDELAEPFECIRCGQFVRGKKFKSESPCKLLTAQTPIFSGFK